MLFQSSRFVPLFWKLHFYCPIMLTIYFSCPTTPKFYIIWPCLKAKLIVILIKSHSVDKNVVFSNFGKIDNLVSIVWTFRCFLCISDVVKASSRPIPFSNTDRMRVKKKKSVEEQLHKEEMCNVGEAPVWLSYLKDSHDRLLTFWKYYVFVFFFLLSVVLNLEMYLELIMQGHC